ncbi:hypothetical protein HGA34_04815 [Candidatus Falkowbacteria bacterium]|nr:hypothetical protein [Candidatus Falkowbacteria bacterium]
MSDGWSNDNPEVVGPFNVFMADGGNYLDIATFKEATKKADEQPGSKVGGRGGGVVYVSQAPQTAVPLRRRGAGEQQREKRSSDLI